MKLVNYTKSGRLVVTVDIDGEIKEFTPSDRDNLFCYWFSYPDFEIIPTWISEFLGCVCLNHEIV